MPDLIGSVFLVFIFMYFPAMAQRHGPLDLDADIKQDTLKLADPSQHCIASAPTAEI